MGERPSNRLSHLLEYSEYRPDRVEVAKWRRLLEDEYRTDEYNGDKVVIVEDKMHFLTGPFLNKKYLVNRVVSDIKYRHEHMRTHEPSLRKAVKDWVDSFSR